MYGEFIVGVNMLFNYAILSFANKIGNTRVAKGRLLCASFLGAIPVTIFPGSTIVVILSFLCMTVWAFGKAFARWKKSATMVLIGALFAGGLLTAFQYQLSTSIASLNILTYALVAYISLHFMKKKWLDVRTIQRVSALRATSSLRIWGVETEVNVFVDSGNGCTEPLSGDPVHFVSFKALEKNIPTDLVEPLLNFKAGRTPSLSAFPDTYHKNMRLIRLMTVQGQSWAVGFKFERWVIGEGQLLRPGYIVLTKNDRRYPAGADAILHVSAMESLDGERRTVYA